MQIYEERHVNVTRVMWLIAGIVVFWLSMAVSSPTDFDSKQRMTRALNDDDQVTAAAAAAAANSGDFIQKDEWDYYGNDIDYVRGVDDYDVCLMRCESTSGCNAFVYFPSSTECWLKNSTGSGGNYLPDRISGHRRNICGGFIRREKWDIRGNDLLSSPVEVSDYGECCIKCQTSAGCNAYVYSPSRNLCWLKTNAGRGGFFNDDRISGYPVNPVTYTYGIYKLVFIDKDQRMNAITREGIIDTFFASYPKMCERFNRESCPRTVRMMIDPWHRGVPAVASGTNIFIGAWISDRAGGDDVIIHEAMHVIQEGHYHPGWLSDGIADYARWKFPVNDVVDLLADHDVGDSYRKSYAWTARFLVWCEKLYPNIVNDLDRSMRADTYRDDIWQEFAGGKTVDELWSEYVANPNW